MYCNVSDTKVNQCTLSNVLFIPKVSTNFFSVRAATQKGNTVQFRAKKCWIRNSKKKLVATGDLNGQMYVLNSSNKVTLALHQVQTAVSSQFELWHQWLGHCRSKRLKEAVKKKLIRGVSFPLNSEQPPFCNGCAASKQTRKPFKSTGNPMSTWSTKKLQLYTLVFADQ